LVVTTVHEVHIMRRRTLISSVFAATVLVVIGAGNGPPLIAKAAELIASQAAATAAVAEVRKSFTIHGKPIPPEILRDMGDGDIADSGSIWIAVDAAAAIGSNLYFDDIKQDGSYVTQTKRGPNNVVLEQTSYSFWGTTQNGLIVLITDFNSGGTGVFYTLHLVDVAAARGFDLDGKLYWRVDLTTVRSVILGDRWEGELKIEKNTIRIITTRKGPTDSGTQPPEIITAVRP
jgi:hypothetical protein